MSAGPSCCRCGGPTRRDQFGQGVCTTGSARRTCGHWWVRFRPGCPMRWVNWTPKAGDRCAHCRSDHAAFFTATHTTPAGEEHRYHAPGYGTVRLLAVVRPKGAGRRLSEITLGPPHSGDGGSSDRRLAALYGPSATASA